nr:transposase [Pedobacter suwonensis]
MSYFPAAPCYGRFEQLKPRTLTYLVLYLNLCRLGQLCGVYYADSTILKVCNNRRIHSYRVFKNLDASEKAQQDGSMGLNCS